MYMYARRSLYLYVYSSELDLIFLINPHRLLTLYYATYLKLDCMNFSLEYTFWSRIAMTDSFPLLKFRKMIVYDMGTGT